jgi:hypothetical protein
MSSITDRIMALETHDAHGTTVSRDDVLAIVKDAIPVEADPTFHPLPDGADEEQHLANAAFDTAYNLLRDTAARLILAEMRAQGVGDLPPDEELFASLAEIPGAPRSYRDLAPRSPKAVAALGDAFSTLLDKASSDALQGIMAADR